MAQRPGDRARLAARGTRELFSSGNSRHAKHTARATPILFLCLESRWAARVFLSGGPFSNPKRIRESAIAQGSWYPEGDEMYAYLNMVYRIENNNLVLEHTHPSTLWETDPLVWHDQVLVPAGMYGIEVFQE